MTYIEVSILALYFLVLGISSLYGIHRYILVYLYYRHKKENALPKEKMKIMPQVTVQLPVFNEMYVVDRLIKTTCQIRYPKDKLEIQVLDDSTDETSLIAKRCVEYWQEKGFRISYIHRSHRNGFKAGALAEGMKKASGEFIAIFDADFVPNPDIIEKTIDYFTDEKVGMVQVRWGHLNRDYSLLTTLQSILLDGHFVIEHAARNRSGRFFNFNGTAGIWRRKCIADAGGWEHDTLTEDLDLSYRAQIRGWNFIFLPDVVSPGEVPVEISAFKSQQYRWAMGSIQTARKVLPKILKSNLPLKIKIESFFHLTGNVSYLLMSILTLLILPSLWIRSDLAIERSIWLDLPLFLAATASVSLFYVVSQKEAYPQGWRRIKYLPLVLALGVGMSVNNAKAVLDAALKKSGEFRRTPKYKIESKGDFWKHKNYRQKVRFMPAMEAMMGLYMAATIIYSIANGLLLTLPFLFLFGFGYFYSSGLYLYQSGILFKDGMFLGLFNPAKADEEADLSKNAITH